MVFVKKLNISQTGLMVLSKRKQNFSSKNRVFLDFDVGRIETGYQSNGNYFSVLWRYFRITYLRMVPRLCVCDGCASLYTYLGFHIANRSLAKGRLCSGCKLKLTIVYIYCLISSQGKLNSTLICFWFMEWNVKCKILMFVLFWNRDPKQKDMHTNDDQKNANRNRQN